MSERGLEASEHHPLLREKEVHVWRKTLRREDEREWSRLEGLLSWEEMERAARFHFQIHRERFVIARATLRQILGRYLGVAPQGVKFRYNSCGKPSLDFCEPNASPEIGFNVSHSHDLEVFAVALEREIGIDLERIEPAFPCLDAAEHVLAEDELRTLRSLSGDEQVRAFFAFWTCKEAILKACGEGFSIDPKSVSLSFSDDPREASVQVFAADDLASWSLRMLDVAEGYAAAVAVRGDVEMIRLFEEGAA